MQRIEITGEETASELIKKYCETTDQLARNVFKLAIMDKIKSRPKMVQVIERTEPLGGASLEEVADKCIKTSNPVTRSVYQTMIYNRLVFSEQTGFLQ